ncbi:MAG: hypothetical protein ACXAB9_12680 [Candidatus Thorarchaeota archaeon]|jgi:hypothetical protein
MITIENWAIGVDTREGKERKEVLQGTVYDHPDFDDGKMIVTLPIAETNGREVQTEKGYTYLLGKVNPEYAKRFPQFDYEGDYPLLSGEKGK